MNTLMFSLILLTVTQGCEAWGKMTHIATLKFRGEKSLEIVYNVMQRPVGHDQTAYSTGMLR